MRQALHSVLQQALAEAEVPIRLGVTVSSLEQDADRVHVQFSDGTEGTYDLVVAAGRRQFEDTGHAVRDRV